MIKKQCLVVLIVLCASFMGFGQIVLDNSATGTGGVIPANWVGQNNITTQSIEQTGTGGYYLVQSSGVTYDYLLSAIYTTLNNSDVTIEFDIATYGAGTNSPLIVDMSTDGGITWVGGTQVSGATPTSTTYLSTSINFNSVSSSNVRFRFYDGISGDKAVRIKNIVIKYLSIESVDWCNVDPGSGIIDLGNLFYVYAQAWENGITNFAGQGSGLMGWIGYSTANTDPSGGGWIWVAASYFDEVGNNDRFRLDIGSVIPTIGTYYYASRFQLNGGPYRYGGFNAGGGGFWNGTTNVNGVLTINARTLDWCNLQSPNVGSISLGNTYNVFAQVYEPGITVNSPAQPGANIQAWIGYSTADNDPSVSGGWTWLPAGHNTLCGANCGFPTENNDEYFTDIGSGLPVGTYYYASRFTIDDPSIYYYGGWSGTGGGFWNGTTNVNGVLTVTLADVVITEIMYNTAGPTGDDEWIEICNISGSAQDISNYIIDVGGTTLFTFPSNTTIASGSCITVSLGSNGDGTYNNGDGTLVGGNCPFTPVYGIGAATDDTDKLFNNAIVTITLYAANGSTPTDSVTYDDIDGGDGNGSSLHVIDASQDNSNASSNWQEVAYGGSSGANTLLPNCLPTGVEINVEGNLGNFPDIADGHISPSPLDNTLFAAQFVGASQSKSYRIQSLFSTDVIISNITITGHSTDFTVTSAPASPVTYLTPSILEITFSPTVSGTRTAVVHIFNNDADESEYTFTVQGDGKCIGVIDSISPTSGPEGTIVTVSASGIDLNSATASFNGLPATTVNYISATDVLEVTVPNGASDGNLELLDGLGCTGIFAFDVIDTKISSCGGSGSLSDLIISEITDATTGGVTYIEIYNGTGSDVSLNGYSIEIFSNGGTSSNSVVLNNVMLLNDNTYVVAIGVSSSPVTTDPGANTCPIVGGNGELAVQTSTVGGINKVDNQHDMIRLVNSGSTVDEFGVYQDNDWMDSTIITGNRGFNFRRLNTASPLPNPTFNINDWNVIDWAGSGLTSCSTNDYSDIGVFDFSTGMPPSVSSGPTIVSSCNTATISVSGSEGSDPAGLAYQWYYNIPGTIGWVEILNTNTDYTGQQGALLTALDTSLLEGYQYYCQIREDDANCYTASDAVQLTIPTTTWNGTTWSSPPTIDKIAILNDDYNTTVGINGESSFSACNLIINDGATLNIANGDYVVVENNLTVNGNIVVQPQGSFVQNNNLGVVDGAVLSNKTKIVVNKKTAKMNNWYEYTYWSSPVVGEKINEGLAEATPNRRFWFNAQNYLDQCAETNNDNTCVFGIQDGIDDAAPYDWTLAAGTDVMLRGVGYASTHRSDLFFGPPPSTPPFQFDYTFEGPFNNGEVPVSVYRNDLEPNDINSNFIGNPYPSAIDVDVFFDLNVYPNGALDGVLYLWSQDTAPSSTTNGNQVLNFSQSDYAIINAGTGETAGGDNNGDGVIDINDKPNRFIPSGQGFFVSASDSATVVDAPGNPDPNVKTANVIFNNSMRMADGTSNSQFFRSNEGNSSKSKKLDNKLWVNLTSDNGVFSQILVGYVDGATNNFDGTYYDTSRNTGLYSTLYSIIEDSNEKFVIQGKAIEDINTDEVINLGFDTNINVPTLYKLSIAQLEGDFLTSNTMYLKDDLLNKVHDLTASDYSFTSEVGEFKDRFEIVFQSESLSDIEAQLNLNKLTIIELNDGRVQLKTNTNLTIKSVQILDLLGRTLYQLKGTSTTEIYNLNNLSQSAYIAKVELSNGQIITKKAIKRN